MTRPMHDIHIHGVAGAPGSLTESNDAHTLGQPEADCARIVKKTGVQRRPVAAPGECTSDLAERAARMLLERHGIAPGDVGILLVCTQTPDHLIPGVSSRLHGRLDLPAECLVMDLNQGCSGFVLGTQTAAALLAARDDDRMAVLVNADTYSRLIRPDDLTTRVLFGDAAAATLLSRRPGGLRVVYSRSYADGRGYEAFIAHNSATCRDPGQPAGICMDGPGILGFALRAVPDAVHRALDDNHLALENIRMVLFHQANSFVVRQLTRKLRLSTEQVPENCLHMGNTVSASIPLLLEEQMHHLHPGDHVLAVGFGVGLSWGVTLLQAC